MLENLSIFKEFREPMWSSLILKDGSDVEIFVRGQMSPASSGFVDGAATLFENHFQLLPL